MERKRTLRTICLALCACLLLGAAPVYADTLSEEDAIEFVFTNIYQNFVGQDTPPWDKQAVLGFEDSEVIQYFIEVTMYGEYDG